MTEDNNDTDAKKEPDPTERRSEPVGAPDGFWNNFEISQVARRVSEIRSQLESRPEQRFENSSVPLEKVGAPGVTSSQLAEYGITMDEARFLRAVVKGMNRDLEGYNLTESMVGIRDHYDIDEEKLIQAGYLKRHAGVDNRLYYTVTFDGQEACGIQKKQGREVGDIGADTPHRVGIDLARRYYYSLPQVRLVELAVRENGGKIDLIVSDQNMTRIAIIEVEGGRVDADPNVSDDDRTGITNYGSVRSDYRMLAESAGESVWVVRNYEIAADVLQILSSGDDIPFGVPKEVSQAVKNADKRIADLNDDYLVPLQDSGISEVVTFRQLRNRLKETNGS